MYLNDEDRLKQHGMFSRIKGLFKNLYIQRIIYIFFSILFLYLFIFFLHEKSPDVIPYNALYIQL